MPRLQAKRIFTEQFMSCADRHHMATILNLNIQTSNEVYATMNPTRAQD